ncbi:MAG: hypothetical protein AMK70_12575 [Nitrospira bacterium SG8_35_1]|nr:MAG: hypothetical protein AMK70_12575 [Nitrospira bacterium SG8_35_1]
MFQLFIFVHLFAGANFLRDLRIISVGCFPCLLEKNMVFDKLAMSVPITLVINYFFYFFVFIKKNTKKHD